MCRVKKEGESILLFSPYSRKFVDVCKKIGGTWLPLTRAWKFQAIQENQVIDICLDFFGECNDLKKSDYITKKERMIKEKSILKARLKEIDEYLNIDYQEIPNELQDND